ncbi:MAG: methyltransferase [Clostridiales bacterium]|nr:methyltransferase [Clostridiales bacterium]
MGSFDELWPGGPGFFQEEGVFKLGSDSVLLSHFANLKRVQTVCDLGSGAGIIPVLLLERQKELKIDAVEISEAAVKLAKKNFEHNGAGVRLIHGDIRRHRELLAAGFYDLVISNPPYFPINSGKSSEIESIARARDERACSVEDVVKAAAYALRWGGRFALVYRPERLARLFYTMTEHGIEPKRLRMVQNKAGSAPSLVLVEGRRGGNPGLIIEPPLILLDDKGGESPEVRRIYRRKSGQGAGEPAGGCQ